MSGNQLRADCEYSPGGNPFGFSGGVETWTVSADGKHLDFAEPGQHESHYSRIP